MHRKRRIAFGWYGGKYSHLSWLLPLLPRAHHYCEPFGGSAAVLLNRTPSPVETYNDARQARMALAQTATPGAMSGMPHTSQRGMAGMDELYRDWRRIDAPPKKCHASKAWRQESLWVNY
ncbi:DNA adenine methylase [Alicyclobacillus mali (ex Roth et al. 2021)]|uniref:DNA adenine methylase n=1 Tax=Alicyclobacillus mali (ex Roth et al. 2021) TaxID=1123961 RepID=UPI0023F1E004|nr:DNA adenine methylase [Alicyclobacillus mali (ex Roth et al. 2021)]